MRRSWAPVAVVVVPLVFVLGVGFAGLQTAGPPQVRVISNAVIDPAYPSETLRDLVSYADQVSVVKVVGERRLPAGDEEESGGYEARTVTVEVEDTIWRGPSGVSAPESLEFTAWGWSGGQPVGAEGGARLEVGHRYLLALARGKDEGKTAWWSFADGAQLHLEGDTLDGEDVLGEPSPIFRRLAGLTVDQAAAVIFRAKPDPIAVEHAELDAIDRWEAVARERG